MKILWSALLHRATIKRFAIDAMTLKWRKWHRQLMPKWCAFHVSLRNHFHLLDYFPEQSLSLVTTAKQTSTNHPHVDYLSEWEVFRLLDTLHSTATGLDLATCLFPRMVAIAIFFKWRISTFSNNQEWLFWFMSKHWTSCLTKAEMGNRMATIDMVRKVEGRCVPFRGAVGSQLPI